MANTVYIRFGDAGSTDWNSFPASNWNRDRRSFGRQLRWNTLPIYRWGGSIVSFSLFIQQAIRLKEISARLAKPSNSGFGGSS